MKKARNKNRCRWRLSNPQPHTTTLKSKICKECWNHPHAEALRDPYTLPKSLNAARKGKSLYPTLPRNKAKTRKEVKKQ